MYFDVEYVVLDILQTNNGTAFAFRWYHHRAAGESLEFQFTSEGLNAVDQNFTVSHPGAYSVTGSKMSEVALDDGMH